MPGNFLVKSSSLKRQFAVYVAITRTAVPPFPLYVGKTGDNRSGCNPVISRCGNHFSFNRRHSQLRNALSTYGMGDPDQYDHGFVFEHFDDYANDPARDRIAVDRINEAERRLNLAVANFAKVEDSLVKLLNPYAGTGHVSRKEQEKRRNLLSSQESDKLDAIVDDVRSLCLRWNGLGA